jgi:hypothetical protein
MADRMSVLVRDSALRIRLGREAALIVRGHNHDRYAADFENFVETVLSRPRRRTPQALLARGIGSLLLAASGLGGVAAPLIRNPALTPAITAEALHGKPLITSVEGPRS